MPARDRSGATLAAGFAWRCRATRIAAWFVVEGGSRISWEDDAVALVDEIERPAHLRRRFTVGY